MCGIVGYIGQQSAAGLLVAGLEKLEYRGYDSAGVAIIDDQQSLVIHKRQGKVAVTAAAVREHQPRGTMGIAHTRWATHGEPSDRNAHPHADCLDTIAVVHNGQLPNYQALRSRLAADGHTLRSDTDTEVIAHLLEEFRSKGDDFVTAVRHTISLLEGGTFALVVIDRREPDQMVAACLGSPMYVGVNDHELFVASDHRAFRASTSRSIQLQDGQMAILGRHGAYKIMTFDQTTIAPAVQELKYRLEDLEKEGYGTFMEKEIHEQPDVIRRVLEGRATDDGHVRLGGIESHPEFARFVAEEMRQVLILGCGTSLFAGEAIARFFQEQGFTVEAMDAAEFATSHMKVTPATLVIPISQSGTTADLLVAMDKVRAAGAVSFALVNVPGSKLTTYGTGMHLQAGPETGVASTKAFVAQVLSGALLVTALAQRDRLNAPHVRAFLDRAEGLSRAVATILEANDTFRMIGHELATTPRMLYIGRGYGLSVAKEGALKMMEIARIPSLGMSAATMKHGPIALVDTETTVVALCFRDPRVPELYDLTLSNVEQVLARGGRVIAITEVGDERVPTLGPSGNHPRHVIQVPAVQYGILTAITGVVPLQAIALHTAAARGMNVDQPMNLAKSVTVL